ncbi:MAG: hypothetical protein WBX01_11925 [Nitrososphaeraceae archaeon]
MHAATTIRPDKRFVENLVKNWRTNIKKKCSRREQSIREKSSN